MSTDAKEEPLLEAKSETESNFIMGRCDKVKIEILTLSKTAFTVMMAGFWMFAIKFAIIGPAAEMWVQLLFAVIITILAVLFATYMGKKEMAANDPLDPKPMPKWMVRMKVIESGLLGMLVGWVWSDWQGSVMLLFLASAGADSSPGMMAGLRWLWTIIICSICGSLYWYANKVILRFGDEITWQKNLWLLVETMMIAPVATAINLALVFSLTLAMGVVAEMWFKFVFWAIFGPVLMFLLNKYNPPQGERSQRARTYVFLSTILGLLSAWAALQIIQVYIFANVAQNGHILGLFIFAMIVTAMVISWVLLRVYFMPSMDLLAAKAAPLTGNMGVYISDHTSEGVSKAEEEVKVGWNVLSANLVVMVGTAIGFVFGGAWIDLAKHAQEDYLHEGTWEAVIPFIVAIVFTILGAILINYCIGPLIDKTESKENSKTSGDTEAQKEDLTA